MVAFRITGRALGVTAALWFVCAGAAAWAGDTATPPSDQPSGMQENGYRKPRDLFLPLIPEPPKREVIETERDTRQEVIIPPRRIEDRPPDPPPDDKIENYQFVTGIVRIDEGGRDERQVLVENRKAQKTYFLKQGDALGQGTIIEIGDDRITVNEWNIKREIPIGFSVSGQKDPTQPGPAGPVNSTPGERRRDRTAFQPPSVGGPPSGGTPAGAESGLPPFPTREVWDKWTPEQRSEFLKRRQEAANRAQQNQSNPTGGRGPGGFRGRRGSS